MYKAVEEIVNVELCQNSPRSLTSCVGLHCEFQNNNLLAVFAMHGLEITTVSSPSKNMAHLN